MKQFIYSIRDDISMEYLPPIFFRTDLECMRQIIRDSFQDKMETLDKSTFTLCNIGECDIANGYYKSYDNPIVVCKLSVIKESYNTMLSTFRGEEDV